MGPPSPLDGNRESRGHSSSEEHQRVAAALAMSGGRALPRPTVAKARAARAKREQRARRAAASSARRAQRRVERERLGRLRDRVIRPSTLKRYTEHAAEFYRWARRTGHSTPHTVEEFDVLHSHWAEHLWSEGDARSILNISRVSLESV